MPQRNRRYEASSLNRRGPGKWTQKTREDVIGSPTTLGDFQALVTEFNAIQLDHRRVLPNVYVGFDHDTGDGFVDYTDRDHIITLAAHDNVSVTGRTFGDANPTTLAAADPLGLLYQTDGATLRTDVVIIDPDHGTNESTTDTDAPVVVTRGATNNCTTPGGTPKSPASLWSTTGAVYRYQFLTSMGDLDENGGGGGAVRLMDAGTGIADRTVTAYVRYSTAHVIDADLYLGKRDGQTDPRRVIIRGYPTDAIPVIPCGTELPTSTTVTELPSIRSGQQSGGQANQARSNVWFRWLWFEGHRTDTFDDGGGGVEGEVYAQGILFFGLLCNNISSRYCAFTEFQAIRPDNGSAGSFPDYVDVAHSGRGFANYLYTAIHTEGTGCDIQYNYFKAAGTDIPFSEYTDASADDVLCRGTEVMGSNSTVAYNTYEGFCSGDYCRALCKTDGATVTNYWCHHNVITSNGYKNLLAKARDTEPNAVFTAIVEQNFIYNYGTNGIQPQGGVGVDVRGTDCIIRSNTIANNINSQTSRDAITLDGLISTADSTTADNDGTQIYGNILYKAGIGYGYGGGWSDESASNVNGAIYSNVIHGLNEGSKDSDFEDAPIHLNFTTGGLGTNNTITGNNITRDVGDTNASVMLVIRTGALTSNFTQYAIDDTLTGYSGNSSTDPEFADAANGNFTIGNSTVAALVPSAPKTIAQVGAWRPPGV